MSLARRGAATRLRVAIGLSLLGAVLAPTGFAVSDRLESDDDFCNACHLTPEVPLHRDIRANFDARPATSLAAAHGAARVAARPEDPAFRCIDCHGGVGALGRARVKALAAKDAFWYVVGRFDEPKSMSHPLRDADCTKCHAAYAAPAPGGAPTFHGVAVHNVDLAVRCVECHGAHAPGGDPAVHFLRAPVVRAQCARCHPEFKEAGS